MMGINFVQQGLGKMRRFAFAHEISPFNTHTHTHTHTQVFFYPLPLIHLRNERPKNQDKDGHREQGNTHDRWQNRSIVLFS